MNGAHIHLMLNHVPIAGFIFGALILLLAWLRKNQTAAHIGYGLLVLTALLTIPTYLSGEPAGHVIRDMPGISRELIHAHEEAAETSAWILWATGLVAAVALGLDWRKKRVPKWMLPLVLLMTLVGIGFVGRSNNLGGKISHQEIRGE